MRGGPGGWVSATIGEVTSTIQQRVPDDTESFLYIDIGAIDRITKRITHAEELLGKNAPSRARKVVQTGDVLVSMTRPNLNAVALVDPSLDGQIASTGFDVLRSPILDPRWLFFAVRSNHFIDRMTELVQGALYPAVRSKDVRGFVIPIAPLPEQKRIGDKLEVIQGRVDACRTRVDRIPALLKRFRQSVLAAATSGQLSEDWRKLHTDSPESQFPTRRLGTLVAEPLRNGKSVRDGEGFPVLRLTALHSGRLDWHETKRGDWAGIDASRFFVKHGDFLIIRGNGSQDLVGRGALAVNPPTETAYPDTLIRIRPDERLLLSRYLAFVWDTEAVRSQIKDAARTTTGLWKVSQGDLESIEIPLPSLPEQQEIVRRVEALFAFADRIEARLATAQKAVERLTPAVLAKAFRGELVPQDPNDEPASALLARLRAEQTHKAAQPKQKVPPRKPAMETPSEDSIRKLIVALPKDRFTFADLRAAVSCDYDTLTGIIFRLLAEKKPGLRQVFDTKAKTMQFQRTKA